jgi:hypothetical protein
MVFLALKMQKAGDPSRGAGLMLTALNDLIIRKKSRIASSAKRVTF